MTAITYNGSSDSVTIGSDQRFLLERGVSVDVPEALADHFRGNPFFDVSAPEQPPAPPAPEPPPPPEADATVESAAAAPARRGGEPGDPRKSR